MRGVHGVKYVLPLVEGQVMASTPRDPDGALVRGVREGDLKSLTGVSNNILYGTLDGFDGEPGIALGSRMANDLNVRIGDEVTLVAPRGAVHPVRHRAAHQALSRCRNLRDRHVVNMTRPSCSCRSTRRRNISTSRTPSPCSKWCSIPPTRWATSRPKIAAAGGPSIYMTDWRQRNATFFNTLQVERNVMFIILTLIVLVAALNIISGMIMLVKDKGRDIGILRTMGATRGAIMRVFFITGASIGVVGTLAGLLLGVLVCFNIERLREFIGWITRHRAVPGRALLPVAAARRHGPERDRRYRYHGTVLVDSGDALSVLARLASRSGRSLALRVGSKVDSPRHAPVLRLERLERAYVQGPRRIEVLKGASASFFPGETVALLGPSGAGKSTLLHIAGLLERPDCGAVLIDGIDCIKLSDKEQTRMRRMEMGFVYQFHHLLPEFSALENAIMPQLIAGRGSAEAKTRAKELLGSLGLSERWDHRPAELSGGEQQRVAIARAVANGPQSPARRRADRQSRSAHGRARVRGAAQARAAGGRGGGGCDPQSRPRRPHGPGAPPLRRPAGRGGSGGCESRPALTPLAEHKENIVT